jgi:hypothetical protein
MFLFNVNDALSEKNMSCASSNPLATVLTPLATPVFCFLIYRKELLYTSIYGKSFKILMNCGWRMLTTPSEPVAYPGILFGGVQQIQLRTKGRENEDLGAVAPSQGFCSVCK